MLNLILNLILIGPLSYVGLALSTAISAWFNALLLAKSLYGSQGFIPDTRLKDRMPRLLFSTLIMGLVLISLEFHFWAYLDGGFLTKLMMLLMLIGSGLVTYLLSTLLTKAIDIQEVRSFFVKSV